MGGDKKLDGPVSDLQRRRELSRMTRDELISHIRYLETGIQALTARVNAAYGDEP